MNKQYSMIALSLALSLAVGAGSAFAAADAGTRMTASGDSPKIKQQAKMSICSKDAKAHSLKGAERRQFMSTCLKAKV